MSGLSAKKGPSVTPRCAVARIDGLNILNMSSRFRNAAIALITFSFALCVLIILADVGIANTPYETTDSAGRSMGFNDPLSLEHYRILLSNFRFGTLLAPAYAYTWFLLAMHGVGVWLLFRVERVKLLRIRVFFALQGVLFPIGWLGFAALPFTIRSMLNGTFDREGIIDIPFIAVTAHPLWIATAMAIVAISWRGSLRPLRSMGSGEPKTA